MKWNNVIWSRIEAEIAVSFWGNTTQTAHQFPSLNVRIRNVHLPLVSIHAILFSREWKTTMPKNEFQMATATTTVTTGECKNCIERNVPVAMWLTRTHTSLIFSLLCCKSYLKNNRTTDRTASNTNDKIMLSSGRLKHTLCDSAIFLISKSLSNGTRA